jgi:hypothetical protein
MSDSHGLKPKHHHISPWSLVCGGRRSLSDEVKSKVKRFNSTDSYNELCWVLHTESMSLGNKYARGDTYAHIRISKHLYSDKYVHYYILEDITYTTTMY